MKIPDGIHTIPVPHGWSPEQAWEAMKRGEQIVEKPAYWVNLKIKNGHFVEIVKNEGE